MRESITVLEEHTVSVTQLTGNNNVDCLYRDVFV